MKSPLQSLEASASQRLKTIGPEPLQALTKFTYQTLTGRRSRRLVSWRQRRCVPEPQTFNEKVKYKMARDRRDILTLFADKVAVREYVRATVGGSYLTTAYAVADSPSEIPWELLPREFVCKVSHGSGGTVIVWDGAPASTRIPVDPSRMGWTSVHVRPEHANPQLLSALCARWQRLDYSWRPGSPDIEWCYQNIQPRTLIEELLVDEQGNLPPNYRFFVFNGRCKAIVVDRPPQGDDRNDVMTPNWNRMPVVKERLPWSDVPPERPENLEECIRVAEALAGSVDFVRVDLYSIAARVVFGEMTNYPCGGNNHFAPASFDSLWGSWWKLDDYPNPTSNLDRP